jgi:adenosine deaminase
LITINSDDPPIFDTTLTDEYLRIVEAYDFDISLVKQLVLNGIKASLLPKGTQQSLDNEFRYQFLDLENELGL